MNGMISDSSLLALEGAWALQGWQEGLEEFPVAQEHIHPLGQRAVRWAHVCSARASQWNVLHAVLHTERREMWQTSGVFKSYHHILSCSFFSCLLVCFPPPFISYLPECRAGLAAATRNERVRPAPTLQPNQYKSQCSMHACYLSNM